MVVSNLFARYDHEDDVLHLTTGSREPTVTHRLDEAFLVEKGICSREIVGVVILGYERFFRSGSQPPWVAGETRLPDAIARFLSERPQFRANRTDEAELDPRRGGYGRAVAGLPQS